MDEKFFYKNLLKILLFLSVIAVLYGGTVVITYLVHFPGEIISDIEKWGQLGDFIGGLLNPAFSVLAFFALLITIIVQTKELALSSEELRKSADALKAQSKSLDLQNFENTFFQMLRLYNEIVSDLNTFGGMNVEDRGRDCFKVYHQAFSSYYANIEMGTRSHLPIDHVEKVYMVFFQAKQGEIGHYFRNLYTIVNFVHESDVDDKRKYTKIIRAQLSSYELVMLFYNCLSSMGRNRFKPLVEKYQLLENMDFSLLTDEEHKSLYDQSAYQENT